MSWHWNTGGTESLYWVGSVKLLRFELNLGSIFHFRDVLGHIIVVVLGPVSQAIQLVVQSGLKICFCRVNDG